MLEKYEICLGLFHGFDLNPLVSGNAQQRISLIAAGQEHILAQERGKERLLQAVKELSESFALAVPNDEALRIRDEVGFFQAVRALAAKPRASRPCRCPCSTARVVASACSQSRSTRFHIVLRTR